MASAPGLFGALFHVYAEADTQEQANVLLSQYVEKIETLRG